MVYRLIRIAFQLMSFIPLTCGQFLGKLLAVPFFVVPLARTDISRDNILKSFKGLMGRDEAERLNRRVLRHFGQMLFEIPHILRMSRDNLDKYVYFVNGQHLQRAKEMGKGVLILTGHFGNWEFMSAAVPLCFGDMAVIARPIDFQPLDRMINEVRSRFGLEIIPKQRAMRKILTALKHKKPVGILLDQNVDWYEGVFVDFLDRWACTNKGLALLAMKTGAPVIPAFSVKQKDGRYCVTFGEQVRLIRTGDKTKDVEENTILFTSIIEKYVRRYPDQWFWFHNRWKTVPYCRFPDEIIKEA